VGLQRQRQILFLKLIITEPRRLPKARDEYPLVLLLLVKQLTVFCLAGNYASSSVANAISKAYSMALCPPLKVTSHTLSVYDR